MPTWPSTSPRASPCRSTPARFTATRLTGHARSSACLWVWSAADPRPGAGGQELDLVADGQAVARERPRHHGPRALDREHAVDEEPGAAGARARRRRRASRRARPTSASIPSPVLAETGTIGRRRQRGAGEPLAHVGLGERERLVVDEVALREGDHAPGDAEHVEDLQVLLGLRLPALVGRDHEQDEPHRPDAGEHVPDEAFVAGHVDEPDLAAARERHPGVAQIDREAAALLLRPPVGVDAGEPRDQRRLAVVDVAGGGDDTELGRTRSVLVRGRRPRARTGARGRGRGTSVGRDRAQVEQHGVVARRGRRPTACPTRSRAAKPAGSATVTRTPARGEARARASTRRRPPTGTCATCAPSRSPPIASQSALRPVVHGRRPSPGASGGPGCRRRGRSRTSRGPTRARRPASCRRGRRARSGAGGAWRRASARPTTIPACGPPSSLSPENSTRSAPSASASATVGSSGGIPWPCASSPEPTSYRNGTPRLSRERGEVLRARPRR